MRKLLYISVIILCLSVGGFWVWKFYSPAPAKPLHLKTFSFAKLPGWDAADALQSFKAFKISCKTFLKQKPEKSVGSPYIDVKAKDWHSACQALSIKEPATDKEAREFFETWFTPVLFHENQPVRGLFTGYYMPVLEGNLTKTAKFNTPIYGLPNDRITINLGLFDPSLKHHRKLIGRLQGKKLVPYYTRAQISKGAIAKSAPVLAWISNKVDLQFLEIEGSGVVQLPDGRNLFLGYAGENGAPYTSIARVLIDKGVMTKDNASMQRIRKYFKQHPKEVDKVLNKNKSFVFFNVLKQEAALGSQGVPLTPGYSLAVDLKWVPIGTPIWLNTTRPDNAKKEAPFQRLMVAQDTGGAIRGAVRGDVYWGPGKEAAYIAGHMKNPGHYWLLLPKHIVGRLKDKIA